MLSADIFQSKMKKKPFFAYCSYKLLKNDDNVLKVITEKCQIVKLFRNCREM